MSSRPDARAGFAGLKPTILRETQKREIPEEFESKILGSTPQISSESMPQLNSQDHKMLEPSPIDPLPRLYAKKRDRLVSMTFRLPASLKDELEKVAKTNDLNQTELLVEGLRNNLRRYPGSA